MPTVAPPGVRDYALSGPVPGSNIAKGFGFAKSMISTYTAVFASPGFLFVEEAPGRLDAAWPRGWRCSYGIPPRRAAERAGTNEASCATRQCCAAETERLLNDPKSRRFVEAFTDYWLDLREDR